MTSKSHSGRLRLLRVVRTSSFSGLLQALPKGVCFETRNRPRRHMSDIPLEPNPAMDLTESGATLDELAEAAAECRACPLYARATQVVFGAGPTGARILMVGEQPGDQEDKVGEPFVGPAGALLDRALTGAGIDRNHVFVINIVKALQVETRHRLEAAPPCQAQPARSGSMHALVRLRDPAGSS